MENKFFYAVSKNPLKVEELSPGEWKQYQQIQTEHRQLIWLRGRKVLKDVLSQMERSLDTSRIKFPNSSLSLTHFEKYSLAFGSKNKFKGVGVDVESYQFTYNPDFLRLLLSDQEKVKWEQWGKKNSGREAIRLWSVKEAIFKSDPKNKKKLIKDYKIENLKSLAGIVDGRFIYRSYPLKQGWMSVAICTEGEKK